MSTSFTAATERGVRTTRRFAPESTGLPAVNGPCLILGEPGGDRSALSIAPGWSRVGRSRSAEIRLVDPSVSRRHALLVRTPGEQLRIIDDRSLTGLYLNGDRVDWARLDDGDELVLGRFRLIVVCDRPAARTSPPLL